MSLSFDGNCGAETRFVRVCLGDGGETEFSVETGQSHRLWVSQGSSYNAMCGEAPYPCPGEFTIALEACSDAPSDPADGATTGKRRPKTEGG
jgi:hypothetical protein